MELSQISDLIKSSKVVERKTSDLIPYAKNARTHSDLQINQIISSIKSFGFTSPVLIAEDGTIIAGHGRTMAAHKMGLETVPCVVLSHLSDTDRRALTIMDNQIALNSSWDKELLAFEIKDLKTQDFDVGILSFSNKDLKSFLTPILTKQEEDDAEVDRLIAEAAKNADLIAKPGDIWALGEHRLLCGSSVDPADVKRLMNGRIVNMVLTDPPYNVAYTGGTKDALTIDNDDMNNEDFRKFLFDFYKNAFEITAPGGAMYVFHADSEGHNFRGALVDAGWLMKQCLIWLKSSFVMGRQDYHWKHEPILYSWKPGASHNWYSDRRQSTVLEFDKPHRNTDHPTPKPVEMLEYLIKNSSAHGDLIYDGFLGSGSTLIACEQTGRVCYGCELAPGYASVVIKRWQNLVGKTAELVEAL